MAAYSTAPLSKPPTIRKVYRTVAAITPADNAAIGPFQAFVAGGAGVVQPVPLGQNTPVAITVIAGFTYEIEFQSINATGTTATGIVGLG
jgi:hypothetical protein